MKEGNVVRQVLPIFVPGKRRAGLGPTQADAFRELLAQYPADFKRGDDEETQDGRPPAAGLADDVDGPPWSDNEPQKTGSQIESSQIQGSQLETTLRPGPIALYLAVENAQALLGEEGELEAALNRLASWADEFPLIYVSLTWAGQNRFGGGNATQEGLTDDGRKLLAALAKHQVCADLSHASNALMDDVIQLVETELPELQVIASHANFRAVRNVVRNLPDDVARWIADRGGIIGLNLIRQYVGDGPEAFAEHVAHAHQLGVADSVCLGADFFGEQDLPTEKARNASYFFDGYDTAACHPALQALLREAGVAPAELQALVHDRLARWLDHRLAQK